MATEAVLQDMPVSDVLLFKRSTRWGYRDSIWGAFGAPVFDDAGAVKKQQFRKKKTV